MSKRLGRIAVQRKTRKPGPEPEILKLEGDWRDRLREVLTKKRPEGGWPERKVKKRKRKKK